MQAGIVVGPLPCCGQRSSPRSTKSVHFASWLPDRECSADIRNCSPNGRQPTEGGNAVMRGGQSEPAGRAAGSKGLPSCHCQVLCSGPGT